MYKSWYQPGVTAGSQPGYGTFWVPFYFMLTPFPAAPAPAPAPSTPAPVTAFDTRSTSTGSYITLFNNIAFTSTFTLPASASGYPLQFGFRKRIEDPARDVLYPDYFKLVVAGQTLFEAGGTLRAAQAGEYLVYNLSSVQTLVTGGASLTFSITTYSPVRRNLALGATLHAACPFLACGGGARLLP